MNQMRRCESERSEYERPRVVVDDRHIGVGSSKDVQVLLIAAVGRVRYNTVTDKVLEKMKQLSPKKLTVLWLSEECIRKDPADWPRCDILWTLWSKDLPLDKLKAYVGRVRPMELNRCEGLSVLCDRRRMMAQCVKYSVPVPEFLDCSRDDSNEPCVEETDDYIVIDGKRLDRPFVEKPVDSRDHNVFIYFPKNAGGGRLRLGRNGWDDAAFDRKNNRTRRMGSYVYERFIPSEGFNMRLFVVGSSYVYAEAKQLLNLSPSTPTGGVSDVKNSPIGHDYREYTGRQPGSQTGFVPVLLEAAEKQAAMRTCLAFGQTTFHVETLRTQQIHIGAIKSAARWGRCGTFVHDVDPSYGGMPRSVKDAGLLDDIAHAVLKEIRHRRDQQAIGSGSVHSPLLTSTSWANAVDDMRLKIHAKLPDPSFIIDEDAFPQHSRHCTWHGNPISCVPPIAMARERSSSEDEDPLASLPEAETLEEPQTRNLMKDDKLLAVLAVVRHGDRTPKEKVKLKLQISEEASTNAHFSLGLICGWIVGQDQPVEVLFSVKKEKDKGEQDFDLRSDGQMERLLAVLRLATSAKQSVAAVATEGNTGPAVLREGDGYPGDGRQRAKTRQTCPFAEPSAKDRGLIQAAIEVLQKALAKNAENVHAKVTSDGQALKVTMKWGGELTSVGEEQGRKLGTSFRRDVYPDEDMAHMHATLRHDLKVHASSEPRCAQTAAAFAQGLLSLEASLAVVQINFVRLDNLGRLDNTPFQHSPLVEKAKAATQALLESERPVDESFEKEALCVPERYGCARAELEACRQQGATVMAKLRFMTEKVDRLVAKLGVAVEQEQEQRQPTANVMEAMSLVRQRWMDLAKDMKGDASQAHPEFATKILDQVNFDLRHTVPRLRARGCGRSGSECDALCEAFHDVFAVVRCIAAYSEIGECGMTGEDKFEIARVFLQPMLRKLRWDLRVASGSALGDETHHLSMHSELYKPVVRGASHSSIVGMVSREQSDRELEEATPHDSPSPKSRMPCGMIYPAEPVTPPLRSRLYFAHNSQMQTLVNLLRWAPWRRRSQLLSEKGEAFLSQMPLPLGYACHLVIKLRGSQPGPGQGFYVISLEFSPGDDNSAEGIGGCTVAPSTVIGEGIPLQEFDAFLSELLDDTPTTVNQTR